MSSPEAVADPAEVPAAPPVSRKAVFVVGSGRSGTSAMAGTLQALGMKVPQPEVAADETNPKGFGEPQWAVDFHTELLRLSGVQVSDARPGSWFEAGRMATVERHRERLHTWLEGQFADLGPELVVKDPRLAWFLGLWRSAATRCGAAPAYVTMLRPVTEVVGSKAQHYAQVAHGASETGRVAGWVNMMLHTERATRGSQRAFVRYADLLEDWTLPLAALGDRFDLRSVQTARANDIRVVHRFIDPGLRRVQLTWDDVEVPGRLRELAEATWERLDPLVDPAEDTAEAHAALDELRTAYADYYADCEAVTESTRLAARREGAASRGGPPKPPAPAAPGRSARLAARVPHRVRAAIPPGARRAFHRVLGR